jgi:hypothetical protein
MMPAIGGIFIFVYFAFIIAVSIYLLVLASRFVGSHERIASALERIAANQRRDAERQP